MKDSELENMSMKELRALMAAVDTAIRASIARDRIERTAKPVVDTLIDLERERDAWKAARR